MCLNGRWREFEGLGGVADGPGEGVKQQHYETLLLAEGVQRSKEVPVEWKRHPIGLDHRFDGKRAGP